MPLSPRRVLRQFRYAMYFDGVDDYVELPLGLRDLTNPTVNPVTVMAFVAPLRLHPPHPDTVVVGGYTFHWFISIPLNTPTAYIYNSVAVLFNVPSGVTVGIGRWAHIATVYRTDYSIAVYVEGELKGTGSWSGTFTRARQYMRIGMRGFRYINAYISQVLIYTRVLPDSEIQWNYNNPDNPVRNGLVLWLQAHPDNIRDIDGDGVPEWLDLSGNGNHGKIYGATLVKLIREPVR